MQEVVHWVPYFLSLICATIYSLGIMLEVCAKLCTQEMNTVGQCRCKVVLLCSYGVYLF